MSRRKLTVWLVAVMGAIFVVGLVAWAKTKGEVPFTKGLEKNGYETFFLAGTHLVSDGQTVQPDDYAASVMRNRKALALVREGLKLRAELPADSYEQRDLALGKVGGFKGLANAMKVEAQYAELQGKQGEAANSYLDIIRFGQKVEAGLLIHFLVGLSVESIGLRGLEGLEPNLQGAERARVAAELLALRESRLPFREVLERERYYMRRNSATPLHYFVGLYMTKAAIAKAQGKHEKHGEELARVAGRFAPRK